MAQKHWHRGSVNPVGLTKDQIVEESLEPEVSIRKFSSKLQVMQVTDMLTQWCGTDVMRWEEWCITPFRAIRHSVRITSLRDDEKSETIYFPVECTCDATGDVKEYWAGVK
jgi:hypothetical protein